MSNYFQIDRLRAAKADIIQAVSAKGVTVPADIKLDSVPALIRQIPEGSGTGGDQFAALIDRSITQISNDQVTSVGTNALQYCKNLVSVSFPAVTAVYNNGLSFCEKLTAVSMPNVETIGAYVFQNCSTLTTIDLPKLTKMGLNSFANNPKLTSINLPVITSISSSAFRSCPEITQLDFPAVTSINSNAFSSCSALETLILRADTVCSLTAVSAFTGTPIISGSGYIYVPRILAGQYQAATNWTTFAAQIRAIEDYPDITGGPYA